MLADTRGQARTPPACSTSCAPTISSSKTTGTPRPEPTPESDEDWQAMNCVLDNGVRTLDNVRRSSTMSSEFFVEAVAYQ
jgi:hypothetical protein